MGAEVVLLGMGAFMQNARTVNSMMAQIGRTSRVLESVSSGAAPLSTSLAGLATTAGVAAAGIVGLGRALSMVKDAATEVLQSSAAYQDQLTFLGAVSDTASGNIFKLSQQQLQMSRTTTTAAADIAVLSEELLKAEVPFNDVTGGALKYANALVIASNGELDAGRAAVTMKIGFDAFKSSGVTYEQVANAINGAAQNSTLSLGNMSDAIKQGGATAARYGLNINEFAAAVALLGQVIPSGTEAGTGLRNMFLQLQKPSKEGKALMNEYGISLHNVDGSTRQFVDILGDLEHAFGPAAIAQGKLTEEQRDYALAAIAGERQQKILSTLIDQGVGSYQRLAEQIANTNGVMATQDLVTATTASKMEMLANNVNALALAFGQGLDPYINAIVGALLQLVQAIDPTLTGMDSLGQMVGGFLVNAFFGLGEVIGSVVIPIFAFFFDMLGAWGQLFAGVAQVVSQVTSIISSLLVSLATIAIQTFGAILDAWFNVGEGVQQGGAFIGNVLNGVVQMAQQAGQYFAQGVQAMAMAFGNVVNAIASGVSTFGQNLNAVVQGAVQAANGVINAFNGLSSAIARILGGAANAINGFLDAASGIPLIGEQIGAARVSVGQFSGATAGAVSAAGVSISGVTANIGNAVANVGAAVGQVTPIVQGGLERAGGAFSDFGSRVNSSVNSLGDTFGNFVDSAVASATKLRNTIKLPEFENYADNISKQIQKARANVTERTPGGIPKEFEPTGERPSSFPASGGGGKKGKSDAEKALDDWAKAMEKAAELLHDFYDDIDNATRDTAAKMGKAFREAEEDIAKATAKAGADVIQAMVDAQEDIDKLDTSRSIERDSKARKDALDDELEYARIQRENYLEEVEVGHDRELEDLQAIEDKKADARQKTFDKAQEAAARAREEIRDAEDREYERSQKRAEDAFAKQLDLAEDALDKRQSIEENALEAQQKAIENALDKEQEARQNALDADQDARKQALEQRLEAERAALEASQQIREDALTEELNEEKRIRDYQLKSDEITREAAEDRAKAEKEYQEEIAIGVKGSIAAARRKQKLDAIQATEDEARSNLDVKKQEDEAELAFEESQQARLAALRATFAEESAALETAQQKAKQEQEIAFENETLALKAQIEQEILDMRTKFADQELQMKERHEREQDQLHEDHEKQRDKFSEDQENARLARQKQRAAEDRAFAEEQEAAKQKFIEEENKRQLLATRQREDEARARKRTLDDADREFRKQEDQKRADLQEQLDNEEYDRRIDQINDERDKKIEAVKISLAEQQAAIEAQLAQEIADLNAQLAEKILTIKTQYVDRMQDLMEQGGENMKPIIDNIGEQMEGAFDGARSSVENLTKALQDALKAANDAANAIRNMPSAPKQTGASSSGGGGGGATIREGGKPGETASEVANYIRNTGGSQADVDKALGKKQYGGVVDGPFGSRQLIWAHGGERFEGIGSGGVTMAAIRAAESMARSGIGSAATTTNNYNYNVNANYGRTQTEGSVRLDLSALVAMTSR